MSEFLPIGDLKVEVVRKDIKNVHLTVHPPEGRVRISAPKRMQMEAIRLYTISMLPWIRRQQTAIKAQERETTRECLDRESHYVWGQRYLLRIVERAAPPAVELGLGKVLLYVRPGTELARRQELFASWYREQVHAAVGPLLEKWTLTLGVQVEKVFVQRMKTKWGSCNPKAGTIRLNTELAKKPPECLEYVIVHEMIHLIERLHNTRFVELMDKHLPGWTHHREILNRLPVGHEEWTY